MALPSSRATPLSTCPDLRPRWCPGHLPSRIQEYCLPRAAQRRLSPAWRAYPNGPQLYIFRGSIQSLSKIPISRGTLDPSSSVLRLPGLHVDFSTDLVANLLSAGTLTVCNHPLGNNNQFPLDLRGIPRFRVYLGTIIRLLCCIAIFILILSF